MIKEYPFHKASSITFEGEPQIPPLIERAKGSERGWYEDIYISVIECESSRPGLREIDRLRTECLRAFHILKHNQYKEKDLLTGDEIEMIKHMELEEDLSIQKELSIIHRKLVESVIKFAQEKDKSKNGIALAANIRTRRSSKPKKSSKVKGPKNQTLPSSPSQEARPMNPASSISPQAVKIKKDMGYLDGLDVRQIEAIRGYENDITKEMVRYLRPLSVQKIKIIIPYISQIAAIGGSKNNVIKEVIECLSSLHVQKVKIIIPYILQIAAIGDSKNNVIKEVVECLKPLPAKKIKIIIPYISRINLKHLKNLKDLSGNAVEYLAPYLPSIDEEVDISMFRNFHDEQVKQVAPLIKNANMALITKFVENANFTTTLWDYDIHGSEIKRKKKKKKKKEKEISLLPYFNTDFVKGVFEYSNINGMEHLLDKIIKKIVSEIKGERVEDLGCVVKYRDPTDADGYNYDELLTSSNNKKAGKDLMFKECPIFDETKRLKKTCGDSFHTILSEIALLLPFVTNDNDILNLVYSLDIEVIKEIISKNREIIDELAECTREEISALVEIFGHHKAVFLVACKGRIKDLGGFLVEHTDVKNILKKNSINSGTFASFLTENDSITKMALMDYVVEEEQRQKPEKDAKNKKRTEEMIRNKNKSIFRQLFRL